MNKKIVYSIAGVLAILIAWYFAKSYLDSLDRAVTISTTVNLADVEFKALALTEEPQDAVFYIRPGFVGGGGGSAPIIDASGDGPLRFNYDSIFFDESKLEEVLKQGKVSSCARGGETIQIKANITLTPSTGTNYSIPPDEEGRQPTASYYVAMLNKLYGIIITCRD